MQYSSSIAISIIGGCRCILGQKDQLLQNKWLHAMAITAWRLMHLDEYSISCAYTSTILNSAVATKNPLGTTENLWEPLETP